MGSPSDLHIAQPLTLKCGLTIPNRLVKAAMAEQLSDSQHLPNERLQAVYKPWAEGGWGMLITGNVQVTTTHLGQPLDPAIPPISSPSLPLSAITPSYAAWARACRPSPSLFPKSSPKPAVIVQLNHPGRQSPRGAGARPFFSSPIAPSPIPISLGPTLLHTAARWLMFGGAPREMTQADIDEVVAQFAYAARVCAEAGFDGVELHAAHGYLLSQFLSKTGNERGDGYGERRERIVVEVVKAVREATKGREGFCVGVKINSVDVGVGVGGGDRNGEREEELRAWVEGVKRMVEAGVDFVEVSGGSYENPVMSVGHGTHEQEKSERTKAREAFFLDFASIIRKECPGVPLLVTGGFSTRNGMERAVAGGDCDLVGLGRPAVLNPALPNNIIFNPEIKDQDAVLYRKKVVTPWILKKFGLNTVGAGMDTIWHTKQLRRLDRLSENEVER